MCGSRGEPLQSAPRVEQEIADITFNFTDLGPFKIWAGGSIDSQDLDIDQDAAEILARDAIEAVYRLA